MTSHAPLDEIAGQLTSEGGVRDVRVVGTKPHSLLVCFIDRPPADDGAVFTELQLSCADHRMRLGPCLFEAHPQTPRRRRDDPPPAPGDGRLIFVDTVYDFSSLQKNGRVVDLDQKLKQLPILWGRRRTVKPSFQAYTVDLLYDLQVYRSLFDEIDRQIADDSPAVRHHVQQIALRTEYPHFAEFLDQKLADLETEVRSYSRQERELHGFYFRKQLWDIILASEFMARTNLKPRGYAGDSAMMRILYDNDFSGETIFAKFMHYHPLQHAAARAVRNRRKIIAEQIQARASHASAAQPFHFISVACGPAIELHDILTTSDACRRFRITLLDQDPEALREARREIETLETRLGAKIDHEIVRGSVRTLLQTVAARQETTEYDLLYSMGLFDYLTPPVAREVLHELFALVRRGGRLLIGNYQPDNPSRTYMDFWLDWVLFYRTEEELLALTEGLVNASCRVFVEPAGAQLFLEIDKT